jgi:hypothetical protein
LSGFGAGQWPGKADRAWVITRRTTIKKGKLCCGRHEIGTVSL